ncbi:Rv0909 family putative TA system antitoxin, partial [Brevibacterium litoralis]|uniref:Rv0909 family putative TA system antitoxin n=1 Tax=Brevibacterium litoralis TaxID=3138935 RepID=UPI0032EFBF32
MTTGRTNYRWEADMGIGDFMDKAKDLTNNEQGEQISDSVLDKASEAASGVAGGQFAEQVEGARDA